MAQVVTIGKKKYAAGLSWGPLDPEKPLRAQAVELARKAKDTFYVLYGEVEPMVGHCDSQNGVRAGMACLAPLVAEIWPANTLLAGVLDDRTAVGVQITNGNIFDDVVGSPEEIRAWFEALSGDRAWDFASSPWGPGEFHKDTFFAQLSDKTYKPPKLRSVGERRGMAVRFGILLLSALIVFLGFSAMLQHRRAMEERLAMMSRHVIRKVIPPATIVPLESFVRACREALFRIPSETSGWDARTVSCRPDRVRVLWVRDSLSAGTVRELEGDLNAPVSLAGEDRARSDLPLSVPTALTPVDRLPALSEEKKDLASVLERYGLKYRMESGSFLPGMDASGPAGGDVSIDLPELPGGSFLSDLARVTGLSVRELVWSGNSRWILKGDLKHAPISFHSKRSPSGTPASVPSGVGSGGNGKPAPSSSGKPSGPAGIGRRETVQGPAGTARGNDTGNNPKGFDPDEGRDRGSALPSVHFSPGK